MLTCSAVQCILIYSTSADLVQVTNCKCGKDPNYAMYLNHVNIAAHDLLKLLLLILLIVATL